MTGHVRNYAAQVAIVKEMTGRNRAAQLEIFKQMSRHEPRNQQAINMELSSDESCCSTANNQARDQAGITQLS